MDETVVERLAFDGGVGLGATREDFLAETAPDGCVVLTEDQARQVQDAGKERPPREKAEREPYMAVATSAVRATNIIGLPTPKFAGIGVDAGVSATHAGTCPGFAGARSPLSSDRARRGEERRADLECVEHGELREQGQPTGPEGVRRRRPWDGLR